MAVDLARGSLGKREMGIIHGANDGLRAGRSVLLVRLRRAELLASYALPSPEPALRPGELVRTHIKRVAPAARMLKNELGFPTGISDGSWLR